MNMYMSHLLYPFICQQKFKFFQFSSVAQSCPTLCDPLNGSTPRLPVHHKLLDFPQPMYIELMPSNHLILCRSLLLLPSIFPSIRVFSNESALRIRRPKYWSFSFNINPSNEYLGLISFGMDWLDLLEVQGTLKSLLKHQSSKASILWRSALFIVQPSHPYMTTGKTIALTRWTSVGKVIMSLLFIFYFFLLFNMLSRLVITFLPRSKHLLISWLQSPSALILEPQKIKSATVSTVSPSICLDCCRQCAMNTGMYVLFQIMLSSTYMPRKGIEGSCGSSTFSFFKESPYCSSQQLYQLTFPPIVSKGSLVSTSSLAFNVCGFFDDSHSYWCKMISHCSFDFHFSNNQQC